MPRAAASSAPSPRRTGAAACRRRGSRMAACSSPRIAAAMAFASSSPISTPAGRRASRTPARMPRLQSPRAMAARSCMSATRRMATTCFRCRSNRRDGRSSLLNPPMPPRPGRRPWKRRSCQRRRRRPATLLGARSRHGSGRRRSSPTRANSWLVRRRAGPMRSDATRTALRRAGRPRAAGRTGRWPTPTTGGVRRCSRTSPTTPTPGAAARCARAKPTPACCFRSGAFAGRSRSSGRCIRRSMSSRAATLPTDRQPPAKAATPCASPGARSAAAGC